MEENDWMFQNRVRTVHGFCAVPYIKDAEVSPDRPTVHVAALL